MNRFAYILLFSLFFSSKVGAYEPSTGWNLFDIGIRGGGTMLVGGQDLRPSLGYTAGLDIDYRLLLPVANDISIGPKIGLGASRVVACLNSSADTWVHSCVSERGLRMVDTLNLKGWENIVQWRVEVPVMAAIRAKGCVVNVGLIPVVSISQERVTHFNNLGVHSLIEAADVTFSHTLALRQDMQRVQPQFQLLAAAEIGYEWRIQKHHRFGIQAYCRCDVLPEQPWSKNEFCTWEGSQLVAGSLTELCPGKLHLLDCGIRLYYAFATPHNYRRFGLIY